MRCERYEEDLALYVEGDLPVEAAGVLERHVRGCQRCEAFLRSLEDSQRSLRSLAHEPLDDAALVGLRERVLAAVRRDGGRPSPARPWLWALAASLVLLASTIVVLRRSAPERPPRPPETAAAVPTEQPKAIAEVTGPATSGPTARAKGGRSTTRGTLPVSPDVGPQNAPAGRALTDEEADQLARAVVLVSRIRGISELSAEQSAVPRSDPLVQLATTDPDIVIYWQVDLNGG